MASPTANFCTLMRSLPSQSTYAGSLSQTSFLNWSLVLPAFCASPVRKGRAACSTAFSVENVVKKNKPTAMMPNRSARNGPETIANSIAVEPLSSRRQAAAARRAFTHKTSEANLDMP